MRAIQQVNPTVGIAAACRALGVARSSLYRQIRTEWKSPGAESRPSPARALGAAERETVVRLLHAERFVDQSPAEVYATLLDEGQYVCSIRTMYRILEETGKCGNGGINSGIRSTKGRNC